MRLRFILAFFFYFLFFLYFNPLHPPHPPSLSTASLSQILLSLSLHFLFSFPFPSGLNDTATSTNEPKNKQKKAKHSLPLLYHHQCLIFTVFYSIYEEQHVSDVNHEMDCRTAWLGCPPYGTAGHCTKGTLFTRRILYFKTFQVKVYKCNPSHTFL